MSPSLSRSIFLISRQKRREKEELKLRDEYEKKYYRYQSYAEKLEAKAKNFRPTEDKDAPDSIDSLYDQLEDPEEAGLVVSQVSGPEAGWLAHHIRRQIECDQQRVREDIESELEVRSHLHFDSFHSWLA
jgi:breast cancer 2 susceptibility protein